MQTECPHRKFCRFDPVRDELSPQAARGRKPGQIVQIDRTGVAVEAGFAVKESEAVCPVRVPPVLRRRPCRRIIETSTKARLPPKKSHMY